MLSFKAQIVEIIVILAENVGIYELTHFKVAIVKLS